MHAVGRIASQQIPVRQLIGCCNIAGCALLAGNDVPSIDKLKQPCLQSGWCPSAQT